jgi:hypothetical protein
VLIGGPTGVGKSWLACALGHKACRDGFSVLYRRAPRLFADLVHLVGTGDSVGPAALARVAFATVSSKANFRRGWP